MLKRINVGAMVFSFYVLPMYLGPIFQFPVNIFICANITNEAFNLKLKAFEEALGYKLLRYSTIALTYYIWLPSSGGLRREILEATGLSEQTHPLIFAALYDYHTSFCLSFLSLGLIITLLTWRQRNLRF